MNLQTVTKSLPSTIVNSKLKTISCQDGHNQSQANSPMNNVIPWLQSFLKNRMKRKSYNI